MENDASKAECMLRHAISRHTVDLIGRKTSIREALQYSWRHCVRPPLSYSALKVVKTQRCRFSWSMTAICWTCDSRISHLMRDSFDSLCFWFGFALSIWTCEIKIHHFVLTVDNAVWIIWFTVAVVFFLHYTKFWNPAPAPAPAGFDFKNPAKSGSGRISAPAGFGRS